MLFLSLYSNFAVSLLKLLSNFDFYLMWVTLVISVSVLFVILSHYLVSLLYTYRSQAYARFVWNDIHQRSYGSFFRFLNYSSQRNWDKIRFIQFSVSDFSWFSFWFSGLQSLILTTINLFSHPFLKYQWMMGIFNFDTFLLLIYARKQEIIYTFILAYWR